jgi:signal transduction histidine kinase
MDQALLDLSVDMQEEDLVVMGDSHGISRLLSILLENASKFTPPGGKVTISATVECKRAVISVRDTGIGIAPEHRM